MGMDAAIKAGAMALFGEKYGDLVRVVKLGDNSIELCGGIHVSATGDLGGVKLISESGVASGIRRVEAVSGERALQVQQQTDETMHDMAALLKIPPSDVLARVQQLVARNKDLGREVAQLQAKLSSGAGRDLADKAESVGNAQLLLQVIEDSDAKALRRLSDQLRQSLDNSAIVLASEKDGKVALIATVSAGLHEKLKAGELLKLVATELGGRGGGRADMAQGGAPSLASIDKAFAAARELVEKQLHV
jgi:alanyl-tRNA synthetase